MDRIDCIQKQSRCVRFSIEASNVSSLCCSPSPYEKILSLEEWNSVWYTVRELRTIRQEARAICIMLKKHRQQLNDCNPTMQVIQKQEQYLNLHTRGLEKYISRRRQFRRRYVSKCILHASSIVQKHNTNKVAAVAVRCTAYATNLALNVASNDFIEAYNEEIHLNPLKDSQNEL